MTKRIFDLILVMPLLAILVLPSVLMGVMIVLTSSGPALNISKRLGRLNKPFNMYKFRTMQQDTPTLPTHMIDKTSSLITPIGQLFRKSSLDELPQLWNILKGDMSFVGPRPALFNQEDLIQLRIENGIDQLVPGLTGWAQVNGRDELTIPEKVAFEAEYLRKQSFCFDIKILLMTMMKVARQSDVLH